MNSQTPRIGVFGDRPPEWVGEIYWWMFKRRLIQLTIMIVRGVHDSTFLWKIELYRQS